MKKPILSFFCTVLLSFTLYAQQIVQVSTFAGSGVAGIVNGQLADARFNKPHGICGDAAGNIYVSDYDNNIIRKITPSGIVSTFAGSGMVGGTDGAGTIAQFNKPDGICIDAAQQYLCSR